MSSVRRATWLPAAGLLLGAMLPLSARGQSISNDFRGSWGWATYATRLDEIPPGYKAKKLADVPRDSLDLTIRQQGRRLSGKCGATSNFLGRVEDGDFTSTVRGNTALLHLTSGFGGNVTARLTRRGNRLLWQVIASHGEEYFPLQVTLHRVSRRK